MYKLAKYWQLSEVVVLLVISLTMGSIIAQPLTQVILSTFRDDGKIILGNALSLSLKLDIVLRQTSAQLSSISPTTANSRLVVTCHNW